MTTDKGASRIKDIAVTAAVASVVSAIVAPLFRKWIEGEGTLVVVDPFPTTETEASSVSDDDFDARLERLLGVPDAISGEAVAALTKRDTGGDGDVG